MELIERAGLSDRVRVMERIPEEELIKLYQGCSLFVFPSREEGFGLTVLEAMACGCAVLANDVEPVSEVVGDAGVLAAMDDPADLASLIAALLDDEARRKSLGDLARQRVATSFDPESLRYRFMGEIERLLDAGQSRPRLSLKALTGNAP
jgi:glycosyltransferase involved in cell wall biosynthesis